MDDMQTVGNGDNINNIDSARPNGTSEQPANLDQQTWTDRGNAAAQAGDYETAAEAFEQAVEADPANARARYNLALAQQYLEESESAIAGYRRAIDLDPQLIDAYTNLGNLYGELGMQEES